MARLFTIRSISRITSKYAPGGGNGFSRSRDAALRVLPRFIPGEAAPKDCHAVPSAIRRLMREES